MEQKRSWQNESGKGSDALIIEPDLHVHFLGILEHDEDTFLPGQPLYFRDQDGSRLPRRGFKKVGDREVTAGETITHIGNQFAAIQIPEPSRVFEKLPRHMKINTKSGTPTTRSDITE